MGISGNIDYLGIPYFKCPERLHSGWLSPPKPTLRGQAGSTYTRIRIQQQLSAAGVETKTIDRDSLRFTYNGTRRVRQLALGCESN